MNGLAALLGAAAMALPAILAGGASAQPRPGPGARPSGISESAGTGTFSRAGSAQPRYSLAPHRPILACEALRGAAVPSEVTILSATSVPPRASDRPSAACAGSSRPRWPST